MKQKESIKIFATQEQFWSFIEDPNNLPLWNPKVRKVTAMNSSHHLGYSFGIMYELSGKAMEYRAEMTRFEPPTHLTFTFTGGSFPSENFVNEEFTITPHGDHCMLHRTIDFSNANIPLWAKILMWIIFRFGSPMGKTYLETLKEIVEKRSKK